MRRLLAALTLCSALAACSSSSSPAADLQSKMNDVVTAANNKDAAALRTAVGVFVEEVNVQSQSGDITTTKAQDLKTVADRVLADASLLEAASPAPSPTSEPSPTQAPSPPPSPSPRYSPPPQPSPSAAPPSPVVVPSVVVTSNPSPAGSPSP